MKFIENLKQKAAAHKAISGIAGILILAGLCVGGYFGWQKYQYMQTGQYALEKVKKALLPPDPNAIAHLVDFNSVTRELADHTRAVFPFLMENPEKGRKIINNWQMALLRNLMGEEKGSSQMPKEETEEEQLKKPLRILPQDFVDQLLSSLKYQEQTPNRGFVSAKITNPLLKKDFTLVMSMEKTPDGWKIKHIINARELLSQLRDAMLQRYRAYRNVFVAKNASTRKLMDERIPIQSCTADAGLLSDNRTLLLVVRVIARNRGNLQINNFNVDTSIMNRAGKVIVHRFLNTAKPVAPGEDFDHSWTFDLDPDSKLGRSILDAGPLHCQAAWQTLSGSDGRVLHIQEMPYADALCATPGHNHPDGFCLLPVFQE